MKGKNIEGIEYDTQFLTLYSGQKMKTKYVSTYFPTHGLNSIKSSSDGFTPSSFLNRASGNGKCMMQPLYKANPHRNPKWKYLWSSCVAWCRWQRPFISEIDSIASIYVESKLHNVALKSELSVDLLWRGTMPAFQSRWTWTSQIQVTPSRETLRKKSLFYRGLGGHRFLGFHQNKPTN